MFDQNFKVLPVALDYTSKKHKIISQNISNFNTPNYKRKVVSFEDELRKALGKTSNIALRTNNEKHITNQPSFHNLKPKIIEDKSKSIRNDGNNVDIDVEMSDMIQNSLKYQAYSRLMTYATQRYETVLRGAR